MELHALPTLQAGFTPRELIFELAETLSKGADADTVFDDMLHTMSCRTAIKAGDITPPTDLFLLAKAVVEDAGTDAPQLAFCPHGRPTCVTMTKDTLLKMFGRI